MPDVLSAAAEHFKLSSTIDDRTPVRLALTSIALQHHVGVELPSIGTKVEAFKRAQEGLALVQIQQAEPEDFND